MEMNDLLKVMIIEQRHFGDNLTLLSEMLNYVLNRNLSFVCLYENKIIGFLKGEKNTEKAQIACLVVENEHRGKGIAKNLIRLSLDSFSYEIRKPHIVSLYVSVDNSIAIRLYQKMGFTISKRIEELFKDKSAGFEMIYENISL